MAYRKAHFCCCINTCRRLCLFLACLFSSSFFVRAQNNLGFVHYTTENGLPDGNIACITQDSFGFMWMGTNDGLCRFDGKEFLIYRRGDKNKSISGNNITSIQEDAQKRLWVGSADGGLCYIDLERKTFKWLEQAEFGFISNTVTSMDFSPQGNLLYVCWNLGDLFSIDTKSLKCQKIPVFDIELPMTYNDVLCGKDGKTYCSPIARRFRVIDEHFKTAPDTINYYPQLAHTISCFDQSADGFLWCGSWDPNLHKIDPSNGAITSFSLTSMKNQKASPNNEIRCLQLYENDKIWCGTNDGLFVFDQYQKTFERYQHRNKDPHSIISNKINCIFKDPQKRMWLGTSAGLSLYDPHSNQFHVDWFSEDENCKVNDLQEIGTNLYIASSCGLFIKNLESNSLVKVDSKYKGEDLIISNIFLDSQRRIFVGTNKTLFLFDSTSLQLRSIENVPKLGYLDFYDIASSQIHSCIEFPFLKTKSIWVEIFGHLLVIFDSSKLRPRPFMLGTEDHIENLINKFFADSQNNLWFLGRTQGLILYEKNSNPLAPEGIHPNEEQSGALTAYFLPCRFISQEANMPFSDVTDMVEANGITYLSTNGHGLYTLTKNTSSFEFNHIEGSPNVIKTIIQDHKGQLWLTNSSRLFIYNPQNKTFNSFGVDDGIPRTGLCGQHLITSSGTIYIGGMGHLISFTPEMPLKNDETPQVHFTHFSIADQSLDSLLLNDYIRLSHDQNYVSVSCAALSYTAAEKNQFMFRLLGLDEEWRYNGVNHVIAFNALPPGSYELQVKASNSDGVWNENPKSLKFEIMPPYYLRWWFFVLIAGLVLGLLYVLYNYRISQLLAMQNLRNKIARDLHDEVGSTLGSISIYSEAARQQLEESNPDQVQDIIRRIGENSREMIEKMSDIVWSVNPENDSVEDLLSRMESFASGVLRASNIQFEVSCAPSLYAQNLSLDERKNVFLIFKEAIYNSLKYSNCSSINTKIWEESDRIYMSVTDNGSGFDTSKLTTHNGNGLKNMKTRASEIGGRLQIESNNIGTIILLDFGKT